MKISYLVGLRNGFDGRNFSTKHQVCVRNEQNPYLIPEKREPNDPLKFSRYNIDLLFEKQFYLPFLLSNETKEIPVEI